MIHISEMSWNKVRHPSQVFKMGDVVEVFVKDIDLKRKRFRCYKKDEDNP
jgi:4-hydroxy-3-methylbut-2-enyl diphosphate reductase